MQLPIYFFGDTHFKVSKSNQENKKVEKFSKFLLTDFSINNESVMLAPASGFYSSKNNGDDEVRIAFVLNSEKLKRAINIIDKGLKEYIS